MRSRVCVSIIAVFQLFFSLFSVFVVLDICFYFLRIHVIVTYFFPPLPLVILKSEFFFLLTRRLSRRRVHLTISAFFCCCYDKRQLFSCSFACSGLKFDICASEVTYVYHKDLSFNGMNKQKRAEKDAEIWKTSVWEIFTAKWLEIYAS